MQKTDNPFSAIALDQGHKQNNAIIKGACGTVGLLSSDMESALRRWEVAGPDVSRSLNEETVYHFNCSEERKVKHHKDNPAFQEMFFKDVSNLFKSFTDICNPFAANFRTKEYIKL